MKRDMSVVRQILLEIERVPAGSLYDFANIERLDRDSRREYFALLKEAGFIDGLVESRAMWGCRRMTWNGYDFLDSIRSEAVWEKVLEKLKEIRADGTVEVIKALATGFVLKTAGMG